MTTASTSKAARSQNALAALAVMALLIIAGTRVARIMQNRRTADKIQTLMQAEKDWIRTNQRSDGAIYLNWTGGSGVGDVNPYFAALAARGLLAGEVSDADLESAGKYLAWHSARVLEQDGKVSDYKLAAVGEFDGVLTPTNEQDSVDAYLAQYLLLLERYATLGGNLDHIANWHSAAQVSIDRLYELASASSTVGAQAGLTRIKDDSNVCYLMDNVEVWAALNGLAALEKRGDALLVPNDFANLIASNIEEHLWNAEAGRYEVALVGDSVAEAQDMTTYYPNVMAQLYPLVYGLDTHQSELDKLLSSMRTQILSDLETSDAVKDWQPLMLSAASRAGRLELAAAVVEHYTACCEKGRTYPYHEGNAGEFLLGCEAYIEQLASW